MIEIVDLPMRFAEKIRVYEPTDCWLWPAYCNRDGYAEAKLDGRSRLLHRWLFERYVGPIPPGKVLRHTCDTPNCVNPEHMLIGTHADNVADRVRRRRCARGEQHGRAKLTWSAVRDIRWRWQAGAVTARAQQPAP